MIKFTPLCILLVLFTFHCPAMERIDKVVLTIATENDTGDPVELTRENAEKFPFYLNLQSNTERTTTPRKLLTPHSHAVVETLVDLVIENPEIIASKKIDVHAQQNLMEKIAPIINELSLPNAINMYDFANKLSIGLNQGTPLAVVLTKKISDEKHQLTQEQQKSLPTDPNIKVKPDFTKFLLNIPAHHFSRIVIETANGSNVETEYHIAQLSKLLNDKIKNLEEQENITINLEDNFDQDTMATTIELITNAYLSYEYTQSPINIGEDRSKQEITNVIDMKSIQQLTSILNFLELLNIQIPHNYKDRRDKSLDFAQKKELNTILRDLRLSIEKDLIFAVQEIHTARTLKKKIALKSFNPNEKIIHTNAFDQTVENLRKNLNPTALKKLINTCPEGSKEKSFVKNYILPQSPKPVARTWYSYVPESAKNLYNSLAEKAYTYRNHLSGAAIAGIGIAAMYYKWLHQSQ